MLGLSLVVWLEYLGGREMVLLRAPESRAPTVATGLSDVEAGESVKDVVWLFSRVSISCRRADLNSFREPSALGLDRKIVRLISSGSFLISMGSSRLPYDSEVTSSDSRPRM